MTVVLASELNFQTQSFESLECKLTFKRLKMEGNSSKEYSILAVMSKEKQKAMKTCFDELHLRFDAD